MPRSRGSSHRSGFSLAAAVLGLQLASTAAADCVELTRVDFEQNEILSPGAAQALIRPLLGQCIDAALTQNLLATVSNELIERGYVTSRAYLAEQDVSDGQLEVRMLVGRIEDIVDADSGLGNSRIDSAFLFDGDILNLRDLESALETMQRLPSVEADFEIRPGSRAGASVIAIETREADTSRLELGAYAQTTLDDRLSLYFALDNPFEINDQLELRFNDGEILETFQSNKSAELAYSFALGGWLVAMSRNDIEYEQRIQGSSGSFVSEGESVSERLGVEKIIARSADSRWSIGLALELKDSKNFFEGEAIDVSSYKTSQLQLELNHDRYLSWGQVASYYMYHKGLDSFGARDDEYFRRDDSIENPARLQFEKHSLGASLVYLLPPPSRWWLESSLHLQYSDDLLFDSDKLNLGSPYTVRGYASALSGSNAWYVRNDIVRQLRAVPVDDIAASGKSLSLSAGIDYGEVDCEADNSDSCGDIYGVGLSLQFSDANFAARLSWGHPLKKIGDDIGDEDIYLLDLRWIL